MESFSEVKKDRHYFALQLYVRKYACEAMYSRHSAVGVGSSRGFRDVSQIFRSCFAFLSNFGVISLFFPFLSFQFTSSFLFERKTAGKYEGVVCIRVPCVIVIVVHVNRGVSVG